MTSRFAAPSRASLSVIMTRGGGICFFSSLRSIRSHPLSQHGPSQGAQERDFAGIGRLTAAGRETALRYTGAPRRPRPTSPTSAKLLNLTHTTTIAFVAATGAGLKRGKG